MTQSPGYRPALGAGGGRGSLGGGMNTLHAPSNMPPPYRAPPHNMAPPPGPPTPKTGPGQAPYSRFNTSEPHLAGQYKSSPVPGLLRMVTSVRMLLLFSRRLSPHHQPREQLLRAEQPEADAGHAQAQHPGHSRPEHGHPASQEPGESRYSILLWPRVT